MCGLCCWGAWLWLGASGLALLLLLCLRERPWRAEPFTLRADALQLEVLRIDWLRLVLDVDGKRVEVYRDELTAEGWCALRRLVSNRREAAALQPRFSRPRAGARRAGRRNRER